MHDIIPYDDLRTAAMSKQSLPLSGSMRTDLTVCFDEVS